MELDCKNWLEKFLLDNGAVLCETVRGAAVAQGYTKAELKSARKLLKVKTRHQFDEGGATQNWFWFIPEYRG